MPDTRMLLLRPAKKTAIALQTSPLRQALYYSPPALKGMPGPYMLPLRQAKKTAIALETSFLKQGLHYSHLLPPAPKVMLELRMLLLLLPEITVSGTETLTTKQPLYIAEVILDLRMLPLLPPEITVFAMETLTAEQTLLTAEVMLDLHMLLLLPPEITVFAMETLTAKQILHKPKSISVVSQPRIYRINKLNI